MEGVELKQDSVELIFYRQDLYALAHKRLKRQNGEVNICGKAIKANLILREQSESGVIRKPHFALKEERLLINCGTTLTLCSEYPATEITSLSLSLTGLSSTELKLVPEVLNLTADSKRIKFHHEESQSNGRRIICFEEPIHSFTQCEMSVRAIPLGGITNERVASHMPFKLSVDLFGQSGTVLYHKSYRIAVEEPLKINRVTPPVQLRSGLKA